MPAKAVGQPTAFPLQNDFQTPQSKPKILAVKKTNKRLAVLPHSQPWRNKKRQVSFDKLHAFFVYSHERSNFALVITAKKQV